MTTNDLMISIVDEVVKELKQKYKNTKLYRYISQHRTVNYEGIEFNYWKELGVYLVGQWIHNYFPDIDIEVNLSGNESNLELAMFDVDQQKLNARLLQNLKKRGIL